MTDQNIYQNQNTYQNHDYDCDEVHINQMTDQNIYHNHDYDEVRINLSSIITNKKTPIIYYMNPNSKLNKKILFKRLFISLLLIALFAFVFFLLLRFYGVFHF